MEKSNWNWPGSFLPVSTLKALYRLLGEDRGQQPYSVWSQWAPIPGNLLVQHCRVY